MNESAEAATGHAAGERSRAFWLISAAALAYGLYGAFTLRWMSDDAYIGLRYAKNLVEGNGLVYNVGERVEGYTAFLWVVWNCLCFVTGISPEAWGIASGLCAYAGSLALLLRHHLWLRRRLAPAPAIPAALILAAAHTDWHSFATSGLETSVYTFLLLVATLPLATSPITPRLAGLCGLVFGLAAITRYDGVLPAGIAGLVVLVVTFPRLKPSLAFGLAFLAVLGPFFAWRMDYYGDLFPNTYYAKSAALTNWGPGLRYVGLYFQKSWPLLLAVPLLVLAARRLRTDRPAWAVWRLQVALFAAISAGFTLYLARLGGDFMFARMLIPVTPLFLLLFELGLCGLGGPRARLVQTGVVVVVAALLSTARTPIREDVVDERAYYVATGRDELADSRGEVLRKTFQGLPVRLMIFGSEARLGYRTEVPYILEAGGLTDAYVARLPLLERGRPGHEKLAPLPYAIGVQKAHFAFHAYSVELVKLREYVPFVTARFGNTTAYVLRWDPPLMEELRRRGGSVPDFLGELDATIARLSSMPRGEVATEYRKLARFYFDHVEDPARRRPFEERLRDPS